VTAALREYVAQVAASVRRSKPETHVLADALLAPLTNWESAKRSTGPSGAGEEPTEPLPAGGAAGKGPGGASPVTPDGE
jgi:hypothetical protein